MKDKPKNRRSRKYSVKWRFCDDKGTPCPEMGWFYEVKKGPKTIRLLPADLDHFNGLRKEAGLQPVGPDWTDKVPVSRVTDRTEVPRVPLADPPAALAAAEALPLSLQKQIAKRIFDYWTARFPNLTTHSVRSDQGGYWGAEKDTPARIGTGLYTEAGEKSRETWMARPDVAVLDLQRNNVPYIVEVEAGTHIKPKVPAGLISTCNMSRWHYPPAPYTGKFDLTHAILFVVLCSSSLADPLSSKAQQLIEFQKHFKTAPGCLAKWIICSGADADATFADFKQRFETICPAGGTAAIEQPPQAE